MMLSDPFEQSFRFWEGQNAEEMLWSSTHLEGLYDLYLQSAASERGDLTLARYESFNYFCLKIIKIRKM